jgi:hypothetical protein
VGEETQLSLVTTPAFIPDASLKLIFRCLINLQKVSFIMEFKSVLHLLLCNTESDLKIPFNHEKELSDTHST